MDTLNQGKEDKNKDIIENNNKNKTEEINKIIIFFVLDIKNPPLKTI